MDFLRLGVRTRAVAALAPWDPARGSPIVERFHGSAYRGDLADFQDYCVHFLGGYELPELKLMAEVCGAIDNSVAYDIGSSTGHHTLVLASVSAAVHAFEPFDRVRAVAQQRMADNRLEHVAIHAFGLAEKNARLPYFWDERNTNSMAGSFNPSHTDMAVHGEFDVRNGDEWRLASGVSPPDFIKIDVEGFEAFALAGLGETLRISEPAILTEISWDGFDNMQTYGGLGELVPFPFDLYLVEPGRDLVFFDFRGLRLTPVENIRRPEKWGYNVFLLPRSRRKQLAVLTRFIAD